MVYGPHAGKPPETLISFSWRAWYDAGSNDRENLDHQFPVYDALYAWRRLEVARSAQ